MPITARLRLRFAAPALALIACSDPTGPSAASTPIAYANFVIAASGKFHSDLTVVAPNGQRGRRLALVNDVPDTPAWSPDGRRLAFHLYFFTATNGAESAIWTVNDDGTHATRLPAAFDEGVSPGWSPDGASISFIRAGALWVARTDGSGARMVATGAVLAGSGRSESWSPDGTRIVYTREPSAGDFQLWTVTADGATSARVPLVGCAKGGAWSRDGRRLAFASCAVADSGTIVLANADGTNRTRLTSDPSAANPVWSPDGSEIAFERAFVPPGGTLPETHLFVVGVSGGAPRDITPDALGAVAPSWRP